MMRNWIFILVVGLPCMQAVAQDRGPSAASEMKAAEPVVARVDGEPIDAAAFFERYAEYLLKTGVRDGIRMRESILQQMIDERLIVLDTRARGIELTTAYRDQLENLRDKMMIEAYVQRAIAGAIEITEKDLEEAGVRINTTITARHLYARTVEEANVLYGRLAAGESFESLAREAFIDTLLANGGGSIGEFTFDETDPDFEDAAFSLKIGEISRPVRTAQGYSIIQVTDRFTKPIVTEMEYVARRPKLRQYARNKAIAQARSRFARSLAANLIARFYEPTFGRLLGQITGTGFIESLETFLHEPLVSFGSTTWTVDQFRTVAARTDPRHRAGVRTEADLKDFITGLAVRSELLLLAKPLAADPRVKRALQGAMDEWILKQRREALASEAVVEDSVRAHFGRYPDEFVGDDGQPLDYERARPLIIEQLRHQGRRRGSRELAARLKDRYDVEVDRHALLALVIAGRTFAHAAAETAVNAR